MWHDLIHGRSSVKYSLTEPSFTSVALLFHVSPTLLWSVCSIIVLTCGGCDVPAPWTSSQISTPAPSAALPHWRSDRPICSNVFSTGTSLGSPLGRTLTPLPPRSATRSTNSLQVSICLRTLAASGQWKSHVLPQPQISTPASANFWRTSLRWSLLRVGSTPCLCVVRSSTGDIPAVLHNFSNVGRSHPDATFHVTSPS